MTKENMNNILAVVITFYPEKELLISNINAFFPYVDKVLVWENTPSDEADNYRFVQNDKVEYQTTVRTSQPTKKKRSQGLHKRIAL